MMVCKGQCPRIEGRYNVGPYCSLCQCSVSENSLIGKARLCPCCKAQVRYSPKIPIDHRATYWKKIKRY